MTESDVAQGTDMSWRASTAPETPADSSAAEICSGHVLIDESNIIREDCVSKRWAVLTDEAIFVSKSATSKKKKRWALHHRCRVYPEDGVDSRTCRVLHSRYMVLSLSYKHSKQTMFCFWLSWPIRVSDGYKRRTRMFAFRDESEATQWHSTLTSVVHALARAQPPSLGPLPPTTPSETPLTSPMADPPRRKSNHARNMSMPAVLSPLAATPEGTIRGADDLSATTASNTPGDASKGSPLGGLVDQAALAGSLDAPVPARMHGRLPSAWSASARSGRTSATSMHTAPSEGETMYWDAKMGEATPRGLNGDMSARETFSYDMGVQRTASGESFVIAHTDNAKPVHISPSPRAWGRFHFVNGLAIWKEGSAAAAAAAACSGAGESASGLDSYMVSKRIRGTPRQVLKTLLRLDGRGSCFWAFEEVTHMRELGSSDHAVQFKATMSPPVRP